MMYLVYFVNNFGKRDRVFSESVKRELGWVTIDTADGVKIIPACRVLEIREVA